jgi:hypothetical protein
MSETNYTFGPATFPGSGPYVKPPKTNRGSSTLGVTTSGRQPVIQNNNTGETKRTVNGKVYTYRNGVLVGVSEPGQGDSRSDYAAVTQATSDAQAEAERLKGLMELYGNMGLGGKADNTAAYAQNALNYLRRNPNTGAEYDPLITNQQGMVNSIQKQLTDGTYKDPYNALRGSLKTIYDNANTNIGAANTGLLASLNASPYSGIKDVSLSDNIGDAGLLEYLQSQGVTTQPLQNEIAANQSAATASKNQFGNMISMLAAAEEANRASRIAEANFGNTFANQGLQANKAAYETQIGAQEQTRQQALMDQLPQLQSALSELLGKQTASRQGNKDTMVELLTKGAKMPKSKSKSNKSKSGTKK